MLAKTLEINWHDGQAIYSIDFSPDGSRYATAGADNSIRIWSIQKRLENLASSSTMPSSGKKQFNKQAADSLPVNIDFLSELKRHSSPVNAVRFSPNGDLLASAGDDTCIIVWKLSPMKETTFGSEYNEYEKETWTVVSMFYGHNKEVYDLAWSPCGKFLITASIDNTARVWCLTEKTCVHVFADHTHYVQGVSWDPLGQYVATQSSDRSVAIYRYKKAQNGKLVFGPCSRKFTRFDKGKLATTAANSHYATAGAEDAVISATGSYRLYHDENLVSFFRRLSFSPDGAFLITPAGLNKPLETQQNQLHIDEANEDMLHCAYIFPRNLILKHPIGLIGNHPKPSIAIRWCHMLFNKRHNAPSFFALPYRMIYATATQDSVYIYDTQQTQPICVISGMHFASLTDLAWSHDGSILMFSSADGYCSAVVFSDGELGSKQERTEQDVEMMDIPNNNHKQIDEWIKPAKRKASLTADLPPPTLDVEVLKTAHVASNTSPSLTAMPPPAAPVSNSEKPKKRRITPILISTPQQ
ncbi:WD40-repeat-containing domain protein [Blakeslea trispora]|nr:WD40-repeat-containing domain protein [Blakeslea trispora]